MVDLSGLVLYSVFMTARPCNIPASVMADLVRLQDLFDLSYGQLTRYLEQQHGIKYSREGMRKAILTWRIDNPPSHNI